MTPEFFDERILKQTIETITKLSHTKGVEYTQGEDRLKNFKTTGSEIDVPPKKVLYIFLKKHFDAIITYVKTGQVHSIESIEGRIDDLILYLILLKGLIYEELNSESLDIKVKRQLLKEL